MPRDVSIFVSHSHIDDEFTERLVQDLITAGADVWVDTDAIRYDDILKRINEGLDGRQWLVLVMSPDALLSEYVQMEVNAALHRVINKWMRGVIPIVARPCEPESIPPTWAILRRYDASQDYAHAFVQLLEALELSTGKGTRQYSSNSFVGRWQGKVFPDESYDGPDDSQFREEPGYDPYAHSGSIRVVDHSGQTRYQTIQAAIIEAEPGDYVYIRPGHYNESLYVDKPIVLVGQGRRDDVVISNEGAEPTIIVEVDNSAGWGYMSDEQRARQNGLWRYDSPVTLSNLTISHMRRNVTLQTVEQAHISEMSQWEDRVIRYALEIRESYSEVRNCTIWCQDGNGLYISPESEYAHPKILVSHCDIHRCGADGISVFVRCRLKIENCKIYENNGNGIDASEFITVENCQIYNNKENGVSFSYYAGNAPLLVANRIAANGKYGVFFSGCLNEETARQNLINNDLTENGNDEVCFDIDCSEIYASLEEESKWHQDNSSAIEEDHYEPPDFEP